MAVPAESQEAWPELSLGMISPSCESRGGTPEGELSLHRGRAAPDGAEDNGSAPAGVPLPFYLFGVRFFPSSLPDLIRQSMRRRGLLRISERLSKLHLCMDHRVKPGGDEIK